MPTIDLRDDELDVLDLALDYLVTRHSDRLGELVGAFDKLAHRISRYTLVEIKEKIAAQREEGPA